MADILDLVCPRCGAENVPGRPPVVTLDETLPHSAGCDVCGFDGNIRLFIRDFQQEKPS